jgi:hypothetical protein
MKIILNVENYDNLCDIIANAIYIKQLNRKNKYLKRVIFLTQKYHKKFGNNISNAKIYFCLSSGSDAEPSDKLSTKNDKVIFSRYFTLLFSISIKSLSKSNYQI